MDTGDFLQKSSSEILQERVKIASNISKFFRPNNDDTSLYPCLLSVLESEMESPDYVVQTRVTVRVTLWFLAPSAAISEGARH